MGSKIFYRELNGTCFSCHNISGDGTYQILSLAVDTRTTDPQGLPIPGAIDPQ